MQRLLHTFCRIKREPRINLGRHPPRHNLQNLLPKLHQQIVERRIDPLVQRARVRLAILHGRVDQLRILGLFRGGEDERRVRGGVLRLVLVDGGEVARVADDGLDIAMIMTTVMIILGQ